MGEVLRRRVGEVELAYELDEAVGERRATLLWLHGGYVSRTEWAPQREVFSKGPWRSIYVDLCGHGQSSKLMRRYDVECFAQDMIGLLDDLDEDHVVVIGHSLGGMVAQVMGRIGSPRQIGLVLADTTYSTDSTLLERGQTLLARASFRMLSIERLAKASAKGLGKRRPDIGPYVYEEMMAFAPNRTKFLAILRATFAFDSRPWLSQIALPTLLLCASDNESTQRQLPGFERALRDLRVHTLPGTGHMLNWDDPAAFNAAVQRFLDEVAPDPA